MAYTRAQQGQEAVGQNVECAATQTLPAWAALTLAGCSIALPACNTQASWGGTVFYPTDRDLQEKSQSNSPGRCCLLHKMPQVPWPQEPFAVLFPFSALQDHRHAEFQQESCPWKKTDAFGSSGRVPSLALEWFSPRLMLQKQAEDS